VLVLEWDSDPEGGGTICHDEQEPDSCGHLLAPELEIINSPRELISDIAIQAADTEVLNIPSKNIRDKLVATNYNKCM